MPQLAGGYQFMVSCCRPATDEGNLRNAGREELDGSALAEGYCA
jgi:hypothetical protein